MQASRIEPFVRKEGKRRWYFECQLCDEALETDSTRPLDYNPPDAWRSKIPAPATFPSQASRARNQRCCLPSSIGSAMLHAMESGQMAKLACEGLVVPCLMRLRAVVVVVGPF